jgi:hypothetical protein
MVSDCKKLLISINAMTSERNYIQSIITQKDISIDNTFQAIVLRMIGISVFYRAIGMITTHTLLPILNKPKYLHFANRVASALAYPLAAKIAYINLNQSRKQRQFSPYLCAINAQLM